MKFIDLNESTHASAINENDPSSSVVNNTPTIFVDAHIPSASDNVDISNERTSIVDCQIQHDQRLLE